ncbi:hypothetical protein BY996DRAFT_4594114 [Phakopsora pachyrhizi]|nr:hypothetical protein BY996DRAFT_4594114 [Phakopsora pachyrhizi]
MKHSLKIKFIICGFLAVKVVFVESQLASGGNPNGVAANSPKSSIQSTANQLNLEPLPLSNTYPPGTPSLIKGAPPLPAATLDPNKYPALDKVPPTNSDVVKEWIAKIDLTKAPNIKPNGVNLCQNTTVNQEAIAKAGADGNCWWSCGGCARDSDVQFCPTKGSWGASFDDGPSPYTPNLLQNLEQNKLKATFFIVGSRAISYPEILKAEYMASHQLCLHTWSHPSLTTITNEEIIAEVAWNMKAFKDILGVTPNCIRPPYADIDDRVRFILKSMGLKVILWTRNGDHSFDTDDWKIVEGTQTPQQTAQSFSSILNVQSSMSTGFIVLAHDLYPQTVAFSMQYLIPNALKTQNLKISAISTCLGTDLASSYVETVGLGTKNITAVGNNQTKLIESKNSTKPSSDSSSVRITSTSLLRGLMIILCFSTF